jgi:uncharacterized DUF497 family protein
MRFEWDEAKRRSNLRRHGFDFVAIEEILSGAIRVISIRKASKNEEETYFKEVKD